MTRVALIISAVLVSGCGGADTSTPTPPVQGVTHLAALQRGACGYQCPVYRVDVLTDGTVLFSGEQFVAVSSAEVQLSPRQFANLLVRLDAYEPLFREWGDFLQPVVPDMATNRVTLRGKTVVHYTGDPATPQALNELEDYLDEQLGTARWISDPPPTDRSPGGPCDRHSTPAVCRASLGPVDAG